MHVLLRQRNLILLFWVPHFGVSIDLRLLSLPLLLYVLAWVRSEAH